MATPYIVPALWLDTPTVDEHAAQRFAERALNMTYDPAYFEAIEGYVQALATAYQLTNQHLEGFRVWRGMLGPLTVVWEEPRNAIITVLPSVRTERRAMHLPFAVADCGWIGNRADGATWRALQQGGRLVEVAPEGWTAWRAPLLTDPVWVHFGLRIMQSTPEFTGAEWDGGAVDYDHQEDRVRAMLRMAARDMDGAWGHALPGGGWLGRTPKGYVVWVDTRLHWLRAAWRPGASRWAADTGAEMPDWERLWEDAGQPVNSGDWERTLALDGYTMEEFEATYWGGWTRLAAHQWTPGQTLPALYWWRHLNAWVWYLGRPLSEEEFRAWATPVPHDLYAWAARTWSETLAQLPKRFDDPRHPCRRAAHLSHAS